MKEDSVLDIVAGRKAVLELVREEPAIVEQVLLQEGIRGPGVAGLVEACSRGGVRLVRVPAGKLEKLFPGNHQGCLARVFGPGFVDLEALLEAAKERPFPLVLVLDQIQDAGNVGTLARTLFGLGGGGLVIGRHNAAHLGQGAIKASAGALLRLPIARETNLGRVVDQAASQGFHTCCAVSGDEGENCYDLEPEYPVLLVLGNEDKGVRPGVSGQCGRCLSIPLHERIDSLNVAQAGAMIMSCLYAPLARTARRPGLAARAISPDTPS